MWQYNNLLLLFVPNIGDNLVHDDLVIYSLVVVFLFLVLKFVYLLLSDGPLP